MTQSKTFQRYVLENLHWSAKLTVLIFLIFAVGITGLGLHYHYILWVGEIIYWGGFVICAAMIYWNYRHETNSPPKAIRQPFVDHDTEVIISLLDEVGRLNAELQLVRSQNRASAKRKEQTAPGYVYLIAIETGLYKIGLTTTPESRMSGLSTGLPYELTLVHTIKCRDRFKIEKFFHEKFASKRVKGEWFALEKDDIEYFKVFVEA